MNLSSQVWYDKIGWEAFLIELNPSPIHRVNEVGITNKVPRWWNERKFLEIQCERAKNYFWERGIQLGSGGKKKRKEKLFDLCKKATVIKKIQLAVYAEDRKSCWRRNYNQIRVISGS